MKKFAIVIICLVMVQLSLATSWVPISSQSPVKASANLISSSTDRSEVRFSLGGFFLNPVMTPRGEAYIVSAGNTSPLQLSGMPDLPKMTVSLIIPPAAGMSVRVKSSSYRDFQGIDIAPSKGVISRDQDPSNVPFSYNSCYLADEFVPVDLAGSRDPYIIRDTRGQTMIFHPFQYNPARKILRVHYEAVLELFKSSESGINPLPLPSGKKATCQEFSRILSRHFLNYQETSDYTPLEEYGNLLVICYSQFMDAIKPYVDWKTAEGYHTELVNKDSVGSNAGMIKSYIADYYNTKGLTHVLLVGDAAQIPTNMGGGLGGPSDNAYGYIVGNDHYSDVFIGRFSAETAAQVETQVRRTLDYEQNPQFLTDDWFTTVIGIASDQGPGDDNEFDYEHIRNQQTQLQGYKYTWNPELFDGSQGGNDAPGNPTPAMVVTEVNNGAGLILYTGHGSNTSWGTSGFSNSNVNQLTNQGKLPFIWSVACVNGNFTATTCFAEAWLRATKNGEPTGAIAFLGSTINQSWNSPMEGQDEMTAILAESYPSNIKRTFAGLSINGCMKMIEAYGNDGANMADTWTVFGDPTIAVRTDVPQPMTVSAGTLLFTGDSTFTVGCDTDSARVTLSAGDSVLATGLVQNHAIQLSFPPLISAGDTIKLVVTAYNRIPFIDSLQVLELQPVNAGFIGVPTSVIPGNNVCFTDTSTGTARSWQWICPGGTPGTSSQQNPVVTYNERGTYDVTLIVGNGASFDTIVKTGYITADWPAGWDAKSSGLGITVTPNPNQGESTIMIPGSGDSPVLIRVTDLVGKTVYSQKFIPSGGKLHLSLPPSVKGNLIFEIQSAQGTFREKVSIY